MSGREWKPGDVALVTEYDPPLLAMVGYRRGSKLLMFKYADGGFDVAGRMDIGDGEELNIAARPLVVIDPEDREQVERLDDLIYSDRFDHEDTVLGTQAALREFANPKPPKPDEPQGLGAVVEVAGGARWVLAYADSRGTPWVDKDGRIADYERLDVVRVLSEGVQP